VHRDPFAKERTQLEEGSNSGSRGKASSSEEPCRYITPQPWWNGAYGRKMSGGGSEGAEHPEGQKGD